MSEMERTQPSFILTRFWTEMTAQKGCHMILGNETTSSKLLILGLKAWTHTELIRNRQSLRRD